MEIYNMDLVKKGSETAKMSQFKEHSQNKIIEIKSI